MSDFRGQPPPNGSTYQTAGGITTPRDPGNFSGYQAPPAPVGGPPSGQFLAVLAQVPGALNGLSAAILQMIARLPATGATVSTLAFTPTAEPPTPTSGCILYADSSNQNRLTIKNQNGAKLVIGI